MSSRARRDGAYVRCRQRSFRGSWPPCSTLARTRTIAMTKIGRTTQYITRSWCRLARLLINAGRGGSRMKQDARHLNAMAAEELRPAATPHVGAPTHLYPGFAPRRRPLLSVRNRRRRPSRRIHVGRKCARRAASKNYERAQLNAIVASFAPKFSPPPPAGPISTSGRVVVRRRRRRTRSSGGDGRVRL